MDAATKDSTVTISSVTSLITPLAGSTIVEQFFQSIPQLLGLLDELSKVRIFSHSF